MRADEFQFQINRLIEQFGKTAYGTERCKLIWQEVYEFEVGWLKKIVDQFIGESRQAPLIGDFRDEISKERERLWLLKKKEHRSDAHDFYNSSYQQEDIKLLCQTIIQKSKGEMDDEKFQGFKKMLENVALNNPKIIRRCRECDDSGLIFHEDEKKYVWVYRCRCPSGDRKPSNYLVYGR